MNEKDFNRAILAQLYAQARKLWAESMEFFQFSGSFTARQLAGALYVHDNYISAEKGLHELEAAEIKNDAAIKKAKKVLAKWKGEKEVCPIMDREKKDEIITVSLDTFSCQFPARQIWQYIYHFEKLAGVGGDVMRFVVPELSEVVAIYEVAVNKDMARLAQYCDKKAFKPIMGGVALDIDAGRVVATDGKNLRLKPLQVVSQSAAVGECVVIPAKEWQAVCRAAGEGATLTIQKIKTDGNTSYRYIIGDIAGRNIPGRYPNYTSVIPKINKAARVRLSAKDWAAEKKALRAYKKDGGARLTIMQRAGKLEFVVTDEVSLEVLHRAAYKPEQAAAVDFAEKYLVPSFLLLSSFDVFLRCGINPALCAVDGGDIVLTMPVQLYEEDRNANSLYDYKPMTGEIDLLATIDKKKEMKSNITASEKIGSAVVEVRTTETEKKEKKAVKATATTKDKAAAPKSAKKTAAKKAAKVAPKTAKKGGFDFKAVGLNVGDELVFVSGAVVTVTDGGKVAYKGELYTLTGFCKKFMPDDRRCKSGAYRGSMYFTRGGVRLNKLAQKAAACVQAGAKAKGVKTLRTATKSPARAKKTAPNKVAAVAPVPVVVPAVVQAVHPVQVLAPVARLSVMSRLRRWAVAAVLLVLVAVGLTAWMQRGPVQDTAPVGFHQLTAPAPTAAALNVPNGASTPVIGTVENHRNGGGYPFGATDSGARLAALIPADKQATNKANNK